MVMMFAICCKLHDVVNYTIAISNFLITLRPRGLGLSLMGKTRAYKHRLDKYYYLARSAGYRSRAAFKLIQLNQQYDFLSKSTCCLDLCAAPGGWSQVAVKYMPVGSTIIAIDLSPIKDIRGVMTLQADITSPKTHHKVRQMMQNNRADLILNDGAPNVGAAWITDSSNQLNLCLASVAFATKFSRKGGWFVTKVFRSEHYDKLLYVLKQFWEQVIPTKPKASRDSSAELFIVCKNYKAPTMVDPRLLDPQFVFSDLEELMKKPAAGDAETISHTAINFTRCTVTSFLKCDNPLDVLGQVNMIEFDEGALGAAAAAHPATTAEVKELCKDLKVIGKAERRVLMRWRKNLRAALIVGAAQEAEKEEEPEQTKGEEEDDDALDEETKKALEELRLKKRRRERAERKHKEKLKAQLIKRLQKNMVAPAANADMLDPATRYGKMYTPKIADDETAGKSWEQINEENLEYLEGQDKDKYVDSDGELMGPVRFKPYSEIVPEEEEEDDEKEVALWYSHDVFDDSEDEEAIAELERENRERETAKAEEEEEPEDEEPDVDDDKPTEEETKTAAAAAAALRGQTAKDFDATAYAMAKRLLMSKHARSEMIDESFNRYMHGDESLPSWFEKDEKEHNRPMIPVTKDDVREWKAKMRDVNAVATKRVIEARARKKQKALQRMKSLQEKADEVAEKEGLDERSKLRILSQIYEKGMKSMDQAPKIVVAKKRDQGNPRYTKSGSQRVKIVDKRLKKDLRGEKRAEERKKKAPHKKKKSRYIKRRQ